MDCKLTPPRHEAIVAELRKGRPIVTACAAAGISDQTFRNWIAAGRHEASPKRYRDFYLEASAALAAWEGEILDEVNEVGKTKAIKEVRCPACDERFQVEFDSATKLRALTWLLETRRPNEYGRKAQVEVKAQGQLQDLVAAMADELTPNEYVRFLEAAARVAGLDVASRAIGSGEGTRGAIDVEAED